MDNEWIVDMQCYHFFNKIYIKEFCCLNIQTDMHWHTTIKCPKYEKATMCDYEIATYEKQFAKHGLTWDYGEMSFRKFSTKLEKLIPPESDLDTIYTSNYIVKSFFRKTYCVELLNIPKWKRLDIFNRNICGDFHKDNFEKTGLSCVKKRCHKVYELIRPALVPYVNLKTLQNYLLSIPVNIPPRDNSIKKYLKAPYYGPVSSLKLNGGNTRYCKHCLAWQDDEEDSDSDDMPEADNEKTNKGGSFLREASNSSAGAASNPISEGWGNHATVWNWVVIGDGQV